MRRYCKCGPDNLLTCFSSSTLSSKYFTYTSIQNRLFLPLLFVTLTYLAPSAQMNAAYELE